MPHRKVTNRERAISLAPISFTRREPAPRDSHRNPLHRRLPQRPAHGAQRVGQSIYPLVPGHEILGRVAAAGSKVTKFKVGDIAAVGVIVDSAANALLATTAKSTSAKRARPSPTRQRSRRRSITWRLLQQLCCRRALRPHGSFQPRPGGVAPLLCAASPPTRRCATGRSAPA